MSGTGISMNVRTRSAVPLNGNWLMSSARWPVDILSRSRTRMEARFLVGVAGAWSGNILTSVSSRLSFPSETASPTAVDVKLLLSEKRTCGSSAAYGAHHPSATTCPCRRIMTLCSASTLCSAPSMNPWIADAEIPCSSRVLRGSNAASSAALASALADANRDAARRNRGVIMALCGPGVPVRGCLTQAM